MYIIMADILNDVRIRERDVSEIEKPLTLLQSGYTILSRRSFGM